MHAFIVRPFGVKQGIDFERVERELIRPALERLGITGGTTAEIVRQGNIRADMFAKLLTADLVIADLSIHNANVFYELGVRHALRDKQTFLIRSAADEVPFDLRTDRYFAYSAERPAESVEDLVAALRATVQALERDSPVFQLLPELEATDPARLLVVPPDFREEVALAVASRSRADLERLAIEVEGLEWEVAGLRFVGAAQIDLGDFVGARDTWESVRRDRPDDTRALLRLGTVYQRLGDLSRSSQVLELALADTGMSSWDRAEARALQGSNEKRLWEEDWLRQAEPGERQPAALRSPHLERALDHYNRGFAADRNHYYSGLNALALVTVLTELARAHAEIWAEAFETDEEAEAARARHEALRADLAAAVRLSIDSALARLARRGASERTEDKEIWARVSQAELTGLTSRRPTRVVGAYRRALAGAPDFVWASARKQLAMREALAVGAETARAVIEAFDSDRASAPEPSEVTAPPRVLLFTGHRIDAPDRPTPRFPASREAEARRTIFETVQRERELVEGRVVGISGAASGGDILFHEVCRELGIEGRVYLAIPPEEYVRASVADAGPDWVERFQRLIGELETRVLSPTPELPRWLEARSDYSIWQRSNLWMLFHALAESGGNLTLIALWNGEPGDGPGGTDDMVVRAQDRGAKVVVLDSRELLV